MPKIYNYEDRLNKDALEEQREKYIQEELEWIKSPEGFKFVKKIIKSVTFSDKIEVDAFEIDAVKKGRVDSIIEEIEKNLLEKNPVSKSEQKDGKFEKEFSKEFIKQQMIKAKIIDIENNILLFDK